MFWILDRTVVVVGETIVDGDAVTAAFVEALVHMRGL